MLAERISTAFRTKLNTQLICIQVRHGAETAGDWVGGSVRVETHAARQQRACDLALSAEFAGLSNLNHLVTTCSAAFIVRKAVLLAKTFHYARAVAWRHCWQLPPRWLAGRSAIRGTIRRNPVYDRLCGLLWGASFEFSRSIALLNVLCPAWQWCAPSGSPGRRCCSSSCLLGESKRDRSASRRSRARGAPTPAARPTRLAGPAARRAPTSRGSGKSCAPCPTRSTRPSSLACPRC